MPKGIYPRVKRGGLFQKGHKINLGKRNSLGKHWKQKNPKNGRIFTEEHKRNISKAHRGMKKPWVKGNPFKIGNLNPNWQGGKSFEPYTTDWTDDLRRAIRKRDKYTCQICGKEPSIHIHHIDYNKKNCNLDNLITLCQRCHRKTNDNREYWINYFRK